MWFFCRSPEKSDQLQKPINSKKLVRPPQAVVCELLPVRRAGSETFTAEQAALANATAAAVNRLLSAGCRNWGMLDRALADGSTPLFAAASRAHEGVVRLLVDAGADIEGNGYRVATLESRSSGGDATPARGQKLEVATGQGGARLTKCAGRDGGVPVVRGREEGRGPAADTSTGIFSSLSSLSRGCMVLLTTS